MNVVFVGLCCLINVCRILDFIVSTGKNVLMLFVFMFVLVL